MTAAALDALVIAVRADVPVLVWGSPGTGKTSAVVDLARLRLGPRGRGRGDP